MFVRLCSTALLIAAGASGPDLKPAPAKEPAVVLAVREVTVFSDRARVTRRGEVAIAGHMPMRIAQLPATIDPESLRLEAEGAKVERVEVRRASLDEFPRAEAEQLVRDLEAARDAENAVRQKIATLEGERQLLLNVRPTTSPVTDPKAQPVLFEPGGWKASVSFLDAREAAIGESVRALEEKARELGKKTQQLNERAQALTGGARVAPGFVVDAWIEGRGVAKLALTYLASNARWYPAYDVRFNPGRNELEIGFAALATQQTGEDWPEANLIFSTAVPATTATLPKLLAWKIGDREQFTPTPVAKPEPPSAPPPAPANRETGERLNRDNELRNRLAALAQAGGHGYLQKAGAKTAINFEDTTIEGELTRPEGSYLATRRPNAPMPKVAEEAPAGMPAQALERRASRGPGAPPPQPAPASVTVAGLRSPSEPSASVEQLPFNSPMGWTSPAYAADLPAALAGGYDFVFPSARAESLRSGPELRRVALHSARFPADARLAIYPALRKHAYLVADVTNSSDRPLLQGTANLFVGADLQGQARLTTTAVGEKIELPLGVDEGIQIERNVNLVTRETGVISKDDVTTYEVVIELLNPHSAPMPARVVDQLPLSSEKQVEIKLDRMEPFANLDKVEGSLEWRLTLAPGAKQTVRFTYTVTRPRGAKLHQW